MKSNVNSTITNRIILLDFLNLCNGQPLTENDDTRCCINTVQPADDEHKMFETCRGLGDRGGTVVKVLCYKSEGDSIPDGVIGIFH